MSEEAPRGDLRFFLGVFIGGLIGAAVIFFLGTKEGKRTGRILGDKGKDFLDDIKDRIGDLEKKGESLVKQGQEIKDDVVERMTDKKEEISASTTERLDDALAHIQKMQEHGSETTAELRKRLFKNLPKKH